jgi:hypothetical protein
MTYAEYLITYIGYERAYFLDFSKHRLTAYQTYAANAKNPVNMENFLRLPTDGKKSYNIEKVNNIRELALKKLKDGKRIKG